MTTKKKLAIVGLSLLAGMLALMGVGLWTLDEVRVNGPLYARIVQGKDLIADILPPPEYALEAHDTGLQLAREADASRRAGLAERLRALSKDFDDRHDFWGKELEASPLREQMEANYRAGHAFLAVLLGDVVPARLRGEDAKEAVARAEKLFETHRQEVLKLVKLSDERNKVDEQAGRDILRSRMTLLVVVALLVLAIGVVMGWLTARQVERGIAALVQEAGALGAAVARGELDHRAAPEAVPGEFAPIARAMNGTMDAFVPPLRIAAGCIDALAGGELPPRVTQAYQGEFARLKTSLNDLVDLVETRGRDVDMLTAAAIEGRLDTRADASKYRGGNAKIIQGMNRLLDAVAKPIIEATAVLDKLARRDLRARVSGDYQGDYAKIKEAMNATADALHEAMSQVAQAVDQVSSASGQIASSSQAVASGASEQASSLEETGSGLESMSSMTKHSADNARQASALAATARDAATEGSAAMQQMTDAMGKIKVSAEGTSQIIKDINEIAFQTNLLALNAAVEAARAGEAGRGFAVVAEEVRSLAQRSKEAANKTEELIRQSVKEAGEGEVTAHHVNKKLSEIVASVSKVTDIVAEIAAAAKEQSSGIEQVNQAMTQMNAVTQQNAASAEESSSAAAELSGQSEELAAMVGTFQIEGVVARKQATSPRTAAAPARKLPGAHKKAQSGTAPSPAQVIPLDDNDDMTFKEF
jgi:methyl-accepting chemotaxis protein